MYNREVAALHMQDFCILSSPHLSAAPREACPTRCNSYTTPHPWRIGLRFAPFLNLTRQLAGLGWAGLGFLRLLSLSHSLTLPLCTILTPSLSRPSIPQTASSQSPDPTPRRASSALLPLDIPPSLHNIPREPTFLQGRRVFPQQGIPVNTCHPAIFQLTARGKYPAATGYLMTARLQQLEA